MDKSYEKIMKLIEASNMGKKIKIRLRQKNSDKYSVYLDFFQNEKREYIYLKRYICCLKETYNNDSETLRYVISFRDNKERELLLDETGFKLKKESAQKADYLEVFKNQISLRKGSTQNKWNTVYKHLIQFTNGVCSIEDIDEDFCRNFYEYINKIGKNSTPKIYFKVFTASLNQLCLKEIIPVNPAKKITMHSDIKSKLSGNKYKKKEFLLIEELNQLISNPINNKQVMNAFLFSCFTGLRFEDIKALLFTDIIEKHLYIRQLKTEEDERLKLNETALKILEEQRELMEKSNDFVFKLSDNKVTNKYLKRWTQLAGITKKITFHCSRHTFATLCISNDVDLYTVSKLLGHKDISSTQIYAKLVDKKKDEAIDKLPKL